MSIKGSVAALVRHISGDTEPDDKVAGDAIKHGGGHNKHLGKSLRPLCKTLHPNRARVKQWSEVSHLWMTMQMTTKHIVVIVTMNLAAKPQKENTKLRKSSATSVVFGNGGRAQNSKRQT